MSESRGGSKFNAKETAQAIPSHRLDEQAAAEVPSTILGAEVDVLRAALSHLLIFARGNDHVLGIIHKALDWRYDPDQKARP